MNKGKKLTAVVAAAATTAAMVAPAFADTTTASFTDISGSYAQDAINALVAQGIIHGVDATHFNPTGDITRQDFSVILAGALGLDVSTPPATATFSDVPTTNYAFKYVEALHKAGIISGVSATEFGYGANISRQDMAVMFVRALGVDVTGKGSSLTFADNDQIASYAKDAVGYAVAQGLFHGMDATHFDPSAPAQRQQVALVAQKFLQLKNQVSVTASATVNADNTVTVTGKATGSADSVKVTVDGGAAQAATLNSDGTYTFTTGVLASGAHTVSVVAYKGTNASQAASASVTVGAYSTSAVTVLNSKQIKVTFSRPVDSTTATTVANYALQFGSAKTVSLTDATVAGNAGLLTNATVSLDSTGTVATITLSAPLNDTTSGSWNLTDGESFNVNVSGIKDGNGNVIPASSTAVVYHDATAPAFVSASSVAATSTNSVQVTFNKPVNFANAQFVVNGIVATATQDADPDTVDLNTGTNYLGAGQSYTLMISNLQDFAGNFAQNPISTNFTVTSDTANQGVASVTASGDNAINVVFKEAMQASTVEAGIKVLDANANDVTSTSGDNEKLVIAPTGGDTTGTKYTISLTGSGIFNSNGVANLSVVFTNSILDLAGNAMAPVTQAVTLNENTVAPTVQSVNYVAPGQYYNGVLESKGAFVVKFNEDVAVPSVSTTANELDPKYLVAVDQNGIDQTAKFGSPVTQVVNNTNDDSILVLPLATALPSSSTSLTLQIKSGAISDASNAANTNPAWTGTVNVSSGSGYGNDTNKPVVANAQGVASTTASDVITYTVQDDDLDNTSVTNVANYLLDGKALPSGSYVTVQAPGTGSTTSTISLNLPSNAVSTTGLHAFTVSNVKDLSGNVASTFGANVQLNDNTAPVLKAATFNADGTLSLDFGEAINTTGLAAADFSIYVNGTKLNPAASTPDYTVSVVASGADAGKVLVTFAPAKEPVAGNTVKVTTNSSATTEDTNGNFIASGVSVTVNR